MKVVKTIKEARDARISLRNVALVPTMGALHAGHLSLMQLAKKQTGRVIVSIFVNPTQFGPREDYTKYPRPIEQDLKMCQDAGVELVFNPPPEEMYRPGLADVTIDLPSLTSTLEGAKRPGHFKGVCQVVAKLFNIIRPEVAVFGQKDYQQLRIITAMAEALDFNITIIPGPTVREPDGLAMSSRNAYLSPQERQKALAIPRALKAAEEQFKAGFKQTNRLMTTMQKILLEQHLLIDYIAAVDPITFKNQMDVTSPTLLATACRVGNTRLIDNTLLVPEAAPA